ncbi:MAG: SMC-Scp complex subunit ScpB [Planctomycetota bacterium]|nr:SMC-Scp complex subunit ScpB [Planctomycetota bacterium]MDA1215062.1 SMC-Scp complex subunit ScpB [Planctomycetota bacterium]
MNLPDDPSEFDDESSAADEFASGLFDEADGFAAGELSADELFPLEDDFSADDLEEAYRRALEVLEEVDQSVSDELEADETTATATSDVDQGSARTTDDEPTTGDMLAAPSRDETHDDAISSVPEETEDDTSAPMSEWGLHEEGDATRHSRRPADAATLTGDSDVPELSPGSPLTPRHVIEAALFVGGGPLTTKKLASLFKGSYENAYIEQQIDDLNRHYLAQNRPYEIQLVEGGHRLTLRPEFEKIRHRVFGFGPKEVRLSQDALEVLALVAYQQPIHRDKVEECGKKNVSNLLNQLVRRELIAVIRGKNAKDLTYHTTPRFLSLFGIGSLDELPRPDDLAFK